MQTHSEQLIAGPRLLVCRPLPSPPILPTGNAPEDKTLQLVELPVGIPGPEVDMTGSALSNTFRLII